MAVAVVIGVAFGAVVKSTVEDLITPLIGIFGKKDFSTFAFTINGSTFRYGEWLNELFAFFLVAAVLFFFIVTPMNKLVARTRNAPLPEPTTRQCPECLSEIPRAASRCRHCTASVVPMKPGS
jgi:large conductance mechanosensitive channel